MRHHHLTLATLTAALLVGCSSSPSPAPSGPLADASSEEDAGARGEDAAGGADASVAPCAEAGGVVSLTTSDGVTLEADYTPASGAGRGAVVLLHMIPPGNDRTSYPPRVREAIAELDLHVLNVDRRGAGGSGGSAQDAYTGETASLDAEAAVSFLLARQGGCAVDRDRITLVGASNGTTTTLDYTVSRQDSSLPDPNALIWLSPGTYTESQHEMSDHVSTLNPIPLLIVHPDSEPWATQLDVSPETCKIVEIPGGAHGTGNFDGGAKEAVQLPAIVSWLQAHTD